jgi:competence/damage-inducible protein CinA-like protein
MLQVAMISTGEEVLHGDIVDTNAAWLSRLFFERGFALSRRTTVGDQLEGLAAEIEHCSLTSDVVIVNGGLGPTSDDLTAQAAAIAADVGLEQSDYWVEQMREKYQKLNLVMPQSNLKQAMLPEGAELLENPIGTACGFAMKLNRAWIFFTPGVPSEFKKMAQEQILTRLKATYTETEKLDCHRFYTFGLSESGIGDTLASVSLPKGYELGYRSSLPFIEVKLFAPAADTNALAFQQQMIDLLGENVVSIGQTLPEHVGAQLVAKQLTLALAEQCSGGWLTNWLQDYPNTKAQLRQGWMLGTVEAAELAASDQLASALAMATASREKTTSDIALVSGPIYDGKVAVAMATPDGDWAQVISTKRQYGSRDMRSLIATVMLDMLRRWLDDQPVMGQFSSLNRESEIFLTS